MEVLFFCVFFAVRPISRMMSNLPAILGMFMAQIQAFPLSVPIGAYPAAQGGMMYGQVLVNGTNNGNRKTR